MCDAIYDIGFYWVKAFGKWTIALFVIDSILNENGWLICGSERLYPTEYFTEIGDKIIASYKPIQDTQ